MKIASIVGARPEFIQALPVTRAMHDMHDEILIHTGQHYDYKMSQSFFDDLNLPDPNYNLEVGSGTHGNQTAQIMVRLEEVLLNEKPDLLIIRGDTNSTLASAIVASKLHIPLVHIEAGERSYNRHMPEEINRLVADILANLHLCASQEAVRRLASEGITETVRWVGDVMYDMVLQLRPIAEKKSGILERYKLAQKEYSLVTIHRSENTENVTRLRSIVEALNTLPETILFPAHPRTKKAIAENCIQLNKNIFILDPVGYFDMMSLELNARIIATDSGGVQREAYFHGIPCLTLREETEWVDTVKSGWNILVGANMEEIVNNWFGFEPPASRPHIFGDGHAGEKIVSVIEGWDFVSGSASASTNKFMNDNLGEHS